MLLCNFVQLASVTIHKRSALLHHTFRAFSAGLLLLLYVVAHIEFDAVHHLLHEEVHITHTVVDEQDPCHLAVYHHAEEKGCHHKAHVSASKKCPLCHFNVVNDTLATSRFHFETIALNVIYNNEIQHTVDTQPILHLPARAPPIARTA